MNSKYTLQLEVIVNKASEGRLVETARRVYSDRGAAREGFGASTRQISAEEFIDGVQNALLELVESNSQLKDAGVEVRAIKCSAGEPISAQR